MIDTTTYTERIECACDICRANATAIGHTFPLSVSVRPATLDETGRSRKAIHNIIHTAHSPFFASVSERMCKRGIPPLAIAHA